MANEKEAQHEIHRKQQGRRISMPEIASFTNIDRKNVPRSITRLEQLGYIRRIHTSPTTYEIIGS